MYHTDVFNSDFLFFFYLDLSYTRKSAIKLGIWLCLNQGLRACLS